MKPSSQFDPNQVATDILKTTVLLEKHYGASYVCRVVQGFDGYGLKKESHRDLETFGSQKGIFHERITSMIYYLLKKEFLEVADLRFGTLRIAEKGEAFLENSEEITLPKSAMITRESDRRLISEMKEIRAQMAESSELHPYEIFTDYTMRCIVTEKPQHVTELKSIPGMDDIKVDQFGHLILEAIQRIAIKMKELAKAKQEYRAKSPSHQSVKKLFNEGKSIAEICKTRSIKPVTAIQYLETLHLAGDVDLTKWIEKQVAPKDLHKGAEYFKQVESPKLREALEVLGLDFETLRLCRLYVANVTTSEDELSAAA